MNADKAVANGGDIVKVRSGAARRNGSENVNGMAHTEGTESSWTMLTRIYYGTYHQVKKQHLQRYVAQSVGMHNKRPLDAVAQLLLVRQPG